MPQTIRQTLLTKLQSSQILAEFKDDLEAIAGTTLRLVGPSVKASELAIPCTRGPLCDRVRSVAHGREHCQRFVSELIIDTRHERLACMQCDAGLSGICVPLRMGGETLGYLLAAGFRSSEPSQTSRNRLRHLLGRMGVPDEASALEAFENDMVSLTAAKEAALRRWLQMVAVALIRSLELNETTIDCPLPSFVVKVCSVIQRRYKEPPSLGEAAELCGLSEAYFCRAFHRFTGLRFVEYIHAVRIEHACELLAEHRIKITEIAFAVGFNSLSQFNRVFRKLKGVAPRQWRSDNFCTVV